MPFLAGLPTRDAGVVLRVRPTFFRCAGESVFTRCRPVRARERAHLEHCRSTPSTRKGVSWKEVEIESEASGDESDGEDNGSNKDDAQAQGGQAEVIPPKVWNGVKAKTLKGILRECHAHCTHLASLDDQLKGLGPIGHFRNPPAPMRGMALSRKVEGSIFDVGLEG